MRQDWIITALRCFLDEILAAQDENLLMTPEEKKRTNCPVIKGVKKRPFLLLCLKQYESSTFSHTVQIIRKDNGEKQWELSCSFITFPSDPHSVQVTRLRVSHNTGKDTLLLELFFKSLWWSDLLYRWSRFYGSGDLLTSHSVRGNDLH